MSIDERNEISNVKHNFPSIALHTLKSDFGKKNSKSYLNYIHIYEKERNWKRNL